MKTWRKDSSGNFNLTVEANPDWFATVFKYDGLWTFRIGTRLKEGETQQLFKSKHRWKSPATAKCRALHAIVQKKYE